MAPSQSRRQTLLSCGKAVTRGIVDCIRLSRKKRSKSREYYYSVAINFVIHTRYISLQDFHELKDVFFCQSQWIHTVSSFFPCFSCMHIRNELICLLKSQMKVVPIEAQLQWALKLVLLASHHGCDIILYSSDRFEIEFFNNNFGYIRRQKSW